MANRSYLYSSNLVPSETNEADRRMTGISEWRSDIPIAFKILLSGNPRKCRSSIWDEPGEIAIAGDYDHGLDRLLRFLDRIPLPEIAPLKEEASQFLKDEANRNHYFVLECGEIFEMEDSPPAEQTDHLLAEIRDIEPVIESTLAGFTPSLASPQKARGFFSRLWGRKPPEPEKRRSKDAIDSLDLGNWSNVLYYDLRKPQ